jgi:hypothetical protein
MIAFRLRWFQASHQFRATSRACSISMSLSFIARGIVDLISNTSTVVYKLIARATGANAAVRFWTDLERDILHGLSADFGQTRDCRI